LFSKNISNFKLKFSLSLIKITYLTCELKITNSDIHLVRLLIYLNHRSMWTPISIDKFIKVHLKKNPNDNETALKMRIEAALDYYKNGLKCQCGKDIWIVGSITAPFGCFSCITGKDHPGGDYEIDSALDKRDRYGRRHIDEMDPGNIAGIFDGDGYEIRKETIKMQPLCLTCRRHYIDDPEEELLCNLNRNVQADENEFKCGAYEKL